MAGDRKQQAVDRYRETAIAFDSLIVQVGRGIARAQEAMDMSQAEFQRQVLKALKEGRMTRLDVNPMNAYAMPETTLELKIGMSMSYPEGEDTPQITAVPLNAATANQNDMNLEAATEIRLRFASVPKPKELPGQQPGVLTPDDVVGLTMEHWRTPFVEEDLTGAYRSVEFAEEERLWLHTYLEAREPSYVVVVDDRSAEVMEAVSKRFLPTADELEPVGPPQFSGVVPSEGRAGDVLDVRGDNFLTLSGQTILLVDGAPVPIVKLSMTSASFKLPEWVTRGDVEVITPVGSTGEAGTSAFTPVPTLDSFEPKEGYFDALRQRGSVISVYGRNLREGCNVRFATGTEGRNVNIVSSGKMQVEVPDGAGTGPLTLVYAGYESSVAETFLMRPRVESFSPRQACVGDVVTLKGNHLGEVNEVLLGDAVIPVSPSSGQIQFQVPPRAFDGRIGVRQRFGPDDYYEFFTREMFYVVPKITGFSTRVVKPGHKLTVYGEGLDPEPDMMTLLFDARGGISEAPVLGVSEDRGSLTALVPVDAVTGYVMLIRKRIFSGMSMADTSNMSLNKITVLSVEGRLSDMVFEERFDDGLSGWTVEDGSWQIENGMLLSEGTARLGRALPQAQGRLALYADVLRAECFGFSFKPAGSSVLLQAWFNYTGTSPELSWSSLDDKQTVLARVPLHGIAGSDRMVRISLDGGVFTTSLDQEVVHTYAWGGGSIEHVSMLSMSATQRWDNVVCLLGDYLSLPAPEFYRFGTIPPAPEAPPLRIDSLRPAKGGEGTEVALEGAGFDETARFFFGGVEAGVVEAAGSRARITVPRGAKSGPVEVRIEVRGLDETIIATSETHFVLPPKISGIVPEKVLAGQELRIMGTNLPVAPVDTEVRILDTPVPIISSSSSMMKVLVPDATGEGTVSVAYKGFVSESPSPVEVSRERVLLDMRESAGDAAWATSAGPVEFGVLAEGSGATVQHRANERMEDGNLYSVLYLRPPGPSQRALRGVYPGLDLPVGRLELRLEFGMLWDAAPAPDDITQVDGVMFEVAFLPAGGAGDITLLPRISCVHDGLPERFVIDAGSLAGKSGEIAVSVFPGRNGLRDHTALIKGELVHKA